ncbi:MAG: DUF166 family protein [Promethearchaeota archaeon]
MKIGLISDGKYGDRAFEVIKKRFDTIWIKVPEIPSSQILDDDFEIDLPDCDLYISYVRHPDIILEIVDHDKPVILGVLPGLGILKQAQETNEKVVGPRTMCSLLPNTGIKEIDKFSKYFGMPMYKIKISKDNSKLVISEMEAIRISPCGSSLAGLEFAKNKALSKDFLQDFALQICHECRAPRFGHTCDKEVSGIIHILSLLKAIEDFNPDLINFFDSDLKLFVQNIQEEYKRRISI